MCLPQDSGLRAAWFGVAPVSRLGDLGYPAGVALASALGLANAARLGVALASALGVANAARLGVALASALGVG